MSMENYHLATLILRLKNAFSAVDRANLESCAQFQQSLHTTRTVGYKLVATHIP